jgi:hypothetical protein
MRQRVLINFLQVTVFVITMNRESGFPYKVTQFVDAAHGCAFLFFALFVPFCGYSFF